MLGVAYQLRPEDPLGDTDQCQRDIALMKELGNNAVRVYHVSTDVDHDSCMKALADAGIYVLLDLDTFDTYVTPVSPYHSLNLDWFKLLETKLTVDIKKKGK